MVDIEPPGVTQTNTGWSRVNRTGNDASANPQSTPKITQLYNTLDCLGKGGGKLITQECLFLVAETNQNYCNNEAPQKIDFGNHGRQKRRVICDGPNDTD